ncbi:Nudix hydrolase 9 [Apostasia shenzhenica]|uniref:Nudix hydrolase 9 n=1 Tax=Apostasia shenzhenica TaxID=1088818 RepID=A0A2I0ALD2_9ASPA|nr:Nudix hydrolase 9 [Apostasia shenzhenica]
MDTNLEESINEIWSRRTEKNPSLYNGKKFRYGGYSFHQHYSGHEVSSVCLHLGLTDYRTFAGTNLSPQWEKFLVPSEEDTIHCQHTASPLGNGAIVETSDKRVLVLRRSHNVGEFPGYFVFPGGHSEPEEVGILTHPTNESSSDHVVLNEKISQEMFEGITREVVEEIGAPSESLSDPIFIGISRRNLNARPTAFFFMKCHLGSHEIHQLYSKAQDGYESTQLYTVLREDLEKMLDRMPGCHRGGYALYEMMKANKLDQ